jgi:hypothetical protein
LDPLFSPSQEIGPSSVHKGQILLKRKRAISRTHPNDPQTAYRPCLGWGQVPLNEIWGFSYGLSDFGPLFSPSQEIDPSSVHKGQILLKRKRAISDTHPNDPQTAYRPCLGWWQVPLNEIWGFSYGLSDFGPTFCPSQEIGPSSVHKGQILLKRKRAISRTHPTDSQTAYRPCLGWGQVPLNEIWGFSYGLSDFGPAFSPSQILRPAVHF